MVSGTGMFYSFRNVLQLKECFKVLGISHRSGFSSRSSSIDSYFKKLMLLLKINENQKNMVLLRDLCCQTYPRAATPVRQLIHPQDSLYTHWLDWICSHGDSN